MSRTTCCVIGGGPAGIVLGLLLARCGVEVTVLEKHGDFLRDFRGDTVHPSTLELLEDLGLSERFSRLPQRRVDRVRLPLGQDGRLVTLADFSHLHGTYDHIAMVPQWDLLDLLVDAASEEPSFTLRMNTEATSFIEEGGRINGVRYRTAEGETGEIRALVTVACDGRNSLARGLPRLGLRDFSTPMDVQWFRLPRHEGDPSGAVGQFGQGRFGILIDRGDYYQAAAIIPKGTDTENRSRPLQEFNDTLIRQFPWFEGRELVSSWDDVKLLDVRMDRLRRWHTPGLLCIGDAAHAMSPVGGVGINLAIQDAVATARHLEGPLRRGRVTRADVAAIQRRRLPITTLIQGLQHLAHHRLMIPALEGRLDLRSMEPPLPLRLVERMPWFRRVPPYVLAYGAQREHPPTGALR
ncbi:FAD-dependent oxidoreductase [Nocardiopsis sp. MG754419]|uniref:FAD-dependent oxidoreductase n=1 Tax=Nocardiopsis sp. MG754419 TaxID=2259865 RepID=UPI001BA95A51|nr:FAD-dependent oxidoreductase [Nocardiopsis sp. MG754419]